MKEYPSINYFFRVFITSAVIGPIAFLLIALISTALQSGTFPSAGDYAQVMWLILIFGGMLGLPGAIIFGIAAKYLSKTKGRPWIKKLVLIALALFLVFLSYWILVGIPFQGLMDGDIFVSYCIAVTASHTVGKIARARIGGLG